MEKLREYLLTNSMPEPNSGCWLWLRKVTPKGYGMACRDGIQDYVHRHSWRAFCSSIPKGKLVLHKCDVRSCLNPNHLFIGTAADNSQDMKRKGRHTPGRKQPLAKLSDETVKTIREDQRKLRLIANDYEVSASLIRLIKARKRWAHVH